MCLCCQVAIETVTYWEQGFGKWNWVVWKNALVVVFGVFALIFGSKSAIEEILAMYTTTPIVETVLNDIVAAAANTTIV